MVFGKKKAEEEPPKEGLRRTCHLCEQQVDSRVWYAKTVEEGKRKKKHDKRIYACPSCYFELPEAERAAYYRERL